jgi:uncharacterized membrane protein
MKKYINTTILGGLAAALPLMLIFMLLRWIVNIIGKTLQPLVELFNTDSKYLILAIYVVAVIAILVTFFLLGWFIQTRIGNFLRNVVEGKYLIKIPGYKTAKDIVMQFFGSGSRSFFSEVVLVDVFNTGTLMTGFITDTHEDYYTVFIPTGPNPTSGNIAHIKKEQVLKTGASVDSGLRSIISCGAGSSDLFFDTKIPSRKKKKQ